jgi:hypothetical protein
MTNELATRIARTYVTNDLERRVRYTGVALAQGFNEALVLCRALDGGDDFALHVQGSEVISEVSPADFFANGGLEVQS